MTKDELLERIKDIPGSAKVFVWADHGQQPFVADFMNITTEDVDHISYTTEEGDIEWDNDLKGRTITGIMLS